MLFITFFSFVLISRSSSTLYFPFKTVSLQSNITSNDKDYNITHYANDHFYLPSFISIKIGSPPQDTKFLIIYSDSGFKIEKSSYCIKDKNYYSFYNKNLSSGFKYINISNYKRKEKLCQDSMQFYTDIELNDEKNYKDIKFYLNSDSNIEESCGIIGLKHDIYKLYKEDITNIFESLKLNDLIQNETWLIKYTSKNEGLFIISPDLNTIYKNYDENKLFTTYREKKDINTWNIIIDKVLSENFNRTINKKGVKAIINNDMDLIEGDWDYYLFITLFYFEPYIKKRICNLEEIPASVYFYFAIECDKEKFSLNDMKKFPILTLVLTCLKSEFKFDYKDVFTETTHKIFFNIIFIIYYIFIRFIIIIRFI